jgi:predicted ATPase
VKMLKFVVEGYRSLKSVTWEVGDLAVVRGPGASELQRAAWLFSNLARGWSTFADAMAEERATEAAFWHPEAIEVRMFALCAPHPEAELEYGHEVIVERVDSKPWWLIGYERATLSNDFELVDVLERMGDRVEYTPPRKKLPGMPVLARAKSEVSRVACDIGTFTGTSGFRRDKRVLPHAEAIARWWLPTARPDFGPEAPVRRRAVPMGFHGALDDDASNLVNLLANVTDWHDAGRAFDRFAREAVAGYDRLAFPKHGDGEVGMELHTRDGRRVAHHELPGGVLRTLAVYATLLSPEPPPLLWLDAPTDAMDPWAAAAVAELALDAARRTQVVVSNPSASLARRLAEVARHPGETLRGGPLKLNTKEV